MHLPIRWHRRGRQLRLHAVPLPEQHPRDQDRHAYRRRGQHRPSGSQDTPPGPGNRHQRDRQQNQPADRHQSDTQPSCHALESCPYASNHGPAPHELRRTAASLTVAEGANVKAVQRMLGHASGRAAADSVRTEGVGPDLDAARLGRRQHG
ncbi:tyrosine-type recombinase/integrase [Micromonospora sp. NPDC049230]|uniref:tyrosine-type recombinase/integrase n=1 Tax=Micromonospora sp. NPDC049230 TaxID=3155502 RepID=UPI0033D61AB6